MLKPYKLTSECGEAKEHGNGMLKAYVRMSIEMHEFRSIPKKSIQSMKRELPRKQMANIGDLPIVHTHASMPYPLQEIRRYMHSYILVWMSLSLCPINICQSPVGVVLPKLDANHGGQVVLICITRRFALLLEHPEVLLVRHYFNGQTSVYLEPLRPLSPLLLVDDWLHFVVVTSTSRCAWHVQGFHVGLG